MRTAQHDSVSARVRELGELFWTLSGTEQHIALQVYRLLAGGEPVRVDAVAHAVDLAERAVEEQLTRWPGVFRDKEGRIEGFWGLTLHPTKHQLEVGGRALYTWCAWDTLFIPLILGRTAAVRSVCEATGDPISLRVGPQGVSDLQPESAVVSFIIPQDADWTRQILTNFCCWVHFFRDAEAGSSWVAGREGAFLLSVTAAFRAGEHKVRYEYGS